MMGGLFFAFTVHWWLFFAPYSSVAVAVILYVPVCVGVSVMVFVSVMVCVVSSGFLICHSYVMLCPSGSVAWMLKLSVLPRIVSSVSCVGV